MADTVVSPNMNLPVPIVGQDAGPQYATDINSCLAVIDGHDHSAGSGVQITPNGININSPLSMNGNNLIAINTLRFISQVSPIAATSPNLLCLQVSGEDLYYNDGAGNVVRITLNGGIAGSPGSIANLTAPASASYVSGTATFVWQSDANIPANMDAGSYILRNITANSKGLTLNPPSAMTSDYSLVMPLIPAQTSVLAIDPSGNISAVTSAVDPTGANQVANSRTRTVASTVGVGGVAISGSSGTAATASASPVDVPNLSVTITTSGRPVRLELRADPATATVPSYAGGGNQSAYYFLRGSTAIAEMWYSPNTQIPPGALSAIDAVSAGTYTYKVQYANFAGSSATVQNVQLVAYEL